MTNHPNRSKQQQAQHTPPIHREPDCANIVADDQRFGLDCWFTEGDESAAIEFATKVVTACNCHDELLAALKLCVARDPSLANNVTVSVAIAKAEGR